MRIVHLTTVHPPRDTRILVREVGSLTKIYDEVTLVAIGRDEFEYNGARVIGVYSGAPRTLENLASRSRLARMVLSQVLALWQLARLRPSVVHGHDPELLPLLLFLRLTGRKVVFDCHEDLGKQMSKKSYLGPLGGSVGTALDRLLHLSSRVLSAVVVAHEWQYPSLPRRYVLRNLPTGVGLPDPMAQNDNGPLHLVYVGKLDENRGAITNLDFLASLRAGGTDARLTLVGEVDPELLTRMKAHPEWSSVDYRGPLMWGEAMAVVAEADIGLFLPKRTPAYDRSESTKVFEYLSLGVAAVVNDMQVYRELVESDDSLAIRLLSAEEPVWPTEDELRLLRATALARAEDVRAGYSWASEERKLVELYERLSA